MHSTPTVNPFQAQRPPPGAFTELRRGLIWLSIPIPFPLRSVNAWLFDEGDSWTLIDTGCGDPETLALWVRLHDTVMQRRPIQRIIATHAHVDHIGAAGALAERYGSSLWTTLGEWAIGRLSSVGSLTDEAQLTRHFIMHGCPAALAASMAVEHLRPSSVKAVVPDSFERIRDGQRIVIGGTEWQAFITGGHASEHVSFYCSKTREYIAGDQILPKVTPIIGVYPELANDDPLGDYLDSLYRLRSVPDDVLILPSHGVPFHGLHRRIDELLAHHEGRLLATATVADDATAYAIALNMFPRAFEGRQGHLALAETLAHLNRLIVLGQLKRHKRHDQVFFSSSFVGSKYD